MSGGDNSNGETRSAVLTQDEIDDMELLCALRVAATATAQDRAHAEQMREQAAREKRAREVEQAVARESCTARSTHKKPTNTVPSQTAGKNRISTPRFSSPKVVKPVTTITAPSRRASAVKAEAIIRAALSTPSPTTLSPPSWSAAVTKSEFSNKVVKTLAVPSSKSSPSSLRKASSSPTTSPSSERRCYAVQRPQSRRHDVSTIRRTIKPSTGFTSGTALYGEDSSWVVRMAARAAAVSAAATVTTCKR